MKYFLFFLIGLFVSCQGGKPYDTSLYTIDEYNKETQENSLIEHPYIFEEEEVRLESLTYKRQDSVITLKAVYEGNTERYRNTCFLFFHAYPKKEGNHLVNMDLKSVPGEGKLVFMREIKLEQFRFEEIRLGMVCDAKEGRIFKLNFFDVAFQ
ncbi:MULTISPECIES: hypothetical protein [Altibacter]|uniref:hypothetical protein n=1 Tax=Altibacter TaxID=1535231 RepID=UPI0012682EE6|nr:MULTISPECIES: hypothetical protein [Altibacter]MCW8980719.1 hypothetical protein [Altibacter sp.]MCW9037371.1 hypothetical protein [Altibacter sp.]